MCRTMHTPPSSVVGLREADAHQLRSTLYFWWSGTQVVVVRSYLKPGAFFSWSLVAFNTRYHLLLSLSVILTASKGTATSFSPAPRKPPTPTIREVTLPDLSSRTSVTSPILLLFWS